MSRFRYTLFSLLALLPMLMTAAPIDSVAAHELASRFVLSGKAVSLRSTRTPLRLIHAEPSASKASAADYYVFSVGDVGGFVIIAGDDRARQVLAYGDSPIDRDNVPDNVQWLLNQYAEQMEYLFTHPEAQPSTAPVFSDASIVQPLLTTRWGQRTPYRDQCPQVDGKPCVTGCVATSMAQVMNYWKFPSFLPALSAYTTSTLGLSVPALPAATVNWGQMLDTYKDSVYTEEQGAAVALLMRYCGQACKMDYTIPSSSASPFEQLKAFKQFGYHEGASFVLRDDYTDDEWHAMIQEDLFAGRPVVYGGSSPRQSHNFVLDGYDNGKYHVNWGWDGQYDGFFELDAMDGGGFRPNLGHNMLHGIFPDDQEMSSDIVVDNIYYNRIGNSALEVTFRDKRYNSYYGDVVIPDTVNLFGDTYVVCAIGDNAFRSSSSLTSVTIPSTITRIGSNAFWKSGVVSVVIPESVTSIGPSAFKDCGKLKSVQLSDSVIIIDERVFANCLSLKNVIMSSSLKTIGKYAFEGCVNLEIIDLPNSLTTISTHAFDRSGLISITIPDSVSSIGASTFLDCLKLESVKLPESLLTIENKVFYGCSALKNVTMNSSLKTVGNYSFLGCVNLETIDLPSSLTSILTHAFEGSGLKCVSIPENVEIISGSAFKDCKQLKNVIIDAKLLSLDQNSFANSPIEIVTCSSLDPPTGSYFSFSPSTYQNAILIVPILAVSRYEKTEPWKNFSIIVCDENDGCIQIDDFICLKTSERTLSLITYLGQRDSLVIPQTISLDDAVYTIDKIGERAFWDNQNLRSVVIPNSVVSIGEASFACCPNLSHVVLSQGLSRIEKRAFAQCGSLANIEITSSITAIGDEAFKQSGLTDILIPRMVSHLGESSFEGCSKLKTVRIESETLIIDDNAFSGNNLTEVICFSEEPPFACANCFSNMTYQSAKLIVLYSKVSEYRSTDPWKNFTRIIPFDSVFDASSGFWFYRTSDYSVSLSGYVGNSVDVVIPDTVSYRNIAFAVTSIDDYVFSNCKSMRTITIPPTICSVGYGAFGGCDALEEVKIKDVVSWCSISFAEMQSNPLLKARHLYIGDKEIHEIVIPDNSIETINKYAFNLCQSITSVSVGKGVKTIDDYAFGNCNNLSSISLPESLQYLGDYVFTMCLALSEVVLPDSLNYIGTACFLNDLNIQRVVLGQNLCSISANAFAACQKLSHVVFGDQLHTIGEKAFYYCNRLDSLYIPRTLSIIGEKAFANCSQLSHVFIMDLASWCGIHYDSSNSIMFEKEWHLYLNGQEIINCKIPDGVSAINDYTFNCCTSFKSLILPNTITEIGKQSFYGCASLNKIICKSLTPPLMADQSVFSDETYYSATLFVPQSAFNQYDTTQYWNLFGKVITYDPDMHGDVNCDDEVNIADVNAIIRAILKGGEDQDLDVNGDDEVNIADVNAVIIIILKGAN